MLRKLMIPGVLCGVLMAAAPAAHAVCPTGFYSLGLRASDPLTPESTLGTAIKFTPTGQPKAVATAACPNWRMAALEISLPADCTQANVVVEYEGLPKGWTLNLGDSPTNNGDAGDAPGTPDREAEIWVLNEDLALAPANELAPALAIDNPLVRQNLALTDAALKFVVKNQFVSWGQPSGLLQTPATKNLFAIPDPDAPAARKRSVYLGLNRVISGPAARKGCGARRVLISFQ